MRAPKRKRPHNRVRIAPPEGIDLNSVADIVAYVGSPEHNDRPSFAGQPRPRSDASIGDPNVGTQAQLTDRLKESVRAGLIGAPWEGGFPRYVWRRLGGIVYEARLVNKASGEYKGYPLEPGQWPDWVEEDDERS